MRSVALPALLILLFSGCRSLGMEKGAQLSYAQVQSIQTGLILVGKRFTGAVAKQP